METKKKGKKLWIAIVPICLLLMAGIITVVFRSGVEAEAKNSPIVNAPKGTGSSAALSGAIVPDTTQTINDHKLVAENENYQLYLYESTLSIIVRDKNSGAIMESTVHNDKGLEGTNATWSGFLQSGVVVELQEDTNKLQKKLDLVNSGAKITVNLVKGGFQAKIDYPNYQFGFDMEVLLYDDGSFTASIPEYSIYENSEKQKIGNIYIFPLLGHTYLGEREGYMLIPDGNGALIYLNDKEGRFSAGYSQKVFGSDIGIDESYILSLFWGKYETHNDAEKVLAPIFGMVHTDSELGYLAVIEKGAEEATIWATPNGAYTNYNWTTASFRKSATYVQPTSNSGGSVTKVTDRISYDIQVRYFMVHGKNATYTGLANRYRDYLLEQNELQKSDNSFNIRLDFLGADVENWLLFKKDVTMTTTENIEEIYESLQKQGVVDIISLYKGWQDGGIWDLPVTSFDAGGSIGGNRKLKNLIKSSKEKGIRLYLYQDVMRANPDTSNTTFNTVKKMDKRLYSENTHRDVFEEFVYWTPSKTTSVVNKLVKSFLKNDINQIAFSGISNNLYTYTINDTMRTRQSTRESYEKLISSISEQTDLLLEEPLSCYWKYTDVLIDMPMGDSDYIFTDQSVPFLSMVLKGIIPMYGNYVNFEANKDQYFLKLIETGIFPSFYLTYEDPAKLIYTNSCNIYSSEYRVYRDTIVKYYNELKKADDLIKDSYMIEHEKLDNGLTVVTYNNGVRFYINYSKKDIVMNGITVPAMSYKVGEAE